MTKLIAPELTHPLRLSVLWPHLEHKGQCKLDIDYLSTTFHVGAMQDHQLVCIGTFLKQHNKIFLQKHQYRLRAMATHPQYRGRGWGEKLIKFAVEELKRREQSLLWCDAREVALGFYAKLGFKVIGEPYVVPNVGIHKLMYFDLR